MKLARAAWRHTVNSLAPASHHSVCKTLSQQPTHVDIGTAGQHIRLQGSTDGPAKILSCQP